MRFRILKSQGICRSLIERYAEIVRETRLYLIVEATQQDMELLKKQCSGITVIQEGAANVKLHQFGYSVADAVTIDEIKELVGFDKLKEAGYTDHGVVVSVVGTGCNIEELPEHVANRVLLFDYTGEGVQDDLNHDTHVIRILGELAPNVTIRCIKVIAKDGSITTRDMLDAVEDAYFESHIINCSWGFEGDQCQFYKWYHGLMTFVYYADPPLYFVSSAGNADGIENAVTYPAADPYAFAVAAISKDGNVMEFSSKGPFYCDGMTVLKPDVATYGVIDIDGTIVAGTSYSAPIVSAFIAWLYNKDSQIKKLSILNGHRVNPRYGYERWSNDYGYGSLHAISGSYAQLVTVDISRMMLTTTAATIGAVMPVIALRSVVDHLREL